QQVSITAKTMIVKRIRPEEHLSGHRAKGGLARRGFTVHRLGHKGTAMITAVKTDHVGLTGCRAGNLDRIFQSLGTGIGQHDFGVALYRNHFTEFLSQFYVALVRHNGLTGMHQLIQLGFDRFNDFRMAVPDIEHTNTTGKINHTLTVGVPDLGIQGVVSKLIVGARGPGSHIAFFQSLQFLVVQGNILLFRKAGSVTTSVGSTHSAYKPMTAEPFNLANRKLRCAHTQTTITPLITNPT